MSVSVPIPIICQETLSFLHMLRPGWLPYIYPLIAKWKERRSQSHYNFVEILKTHHLSENLSVCMGAGCSRVQTLYRDPDYQRIIVPGKSRGESISNGN